LWAPHLSPDGKRVAVTVLTEGNLDVWVYEWERDTMTRLTFTPGFDGFPVWSPDGKHIVFRSDRQGSAGNLYWMRADGGGEAVRLTESKDQQLPFSFSPDGKRLAFLELKPQENFDIWMLPLEDVESDHPKAAKPEPFLETPFSEWGTHNLPGWPLGSIRIRRIRQQRSIRAAVFRPGRQVANLNRRWRAGPQVDAIRRPSQPGVVENAAGIILPKPSGHHGRQLRWPRRGVCSG